MKHIAFLLAVLMILTGALASCSEKGDNAAGESAGAGSEAPSPEAAEAEAGEETAKPGRERVSDGLPEGLDFDGAAILFYTNPYTPYACNFVEELTGEMLNDARYDTETAVEERLNVAIGEDYGDPDPYTFNGQVKTLIKAGDRTYSYMTDEDYIIMAQIQEGSFYALSDVEYLDLGAPYWLPDATDLYKIGGKVWYAFCPLNLYANQNTNFIAMNLDLADSVGIGAQYDAVREGSWTFEKMIALANSAYIDLNNNGFDGADQWGINIDNPPKNEWCGVLVGCGSMQEIITKDEEGYLTYGYSEGLVDRLELAYNIFHDFGLGRNDMPSFSKGKVLFSFSKFETLTTTYREVDFNFAVLPMPKYDELQDGYHSRTFDTCSPVIPVTCPDPDMAGAVLEALTCEAYNTTLPAYIETGLQNKYVRDEDSSEMAMIVLDSQTVLVPEIMMFDQYGNSSFQTAFIEKNEMMAASVLEKKKAVTEKTIERLNKKYKALIDG
jgi:hypothetical protein